MKIIEKHILRGPNYWSVRKPKVILVKLDIEEYEEIPSNKIEGFYERLLLLFPGMYEHYCSEGKPGGFFNRVREGTWMGHIFEHVALELQTLAGIKCNFGRTRQTDKKGIYNVVFSYEEERAGLYAMDAALRVLDSLIHAKDYNINNDVAEIKKIAEEDRLGPSTSSIVSAATERNIPFLRIGNGSLVQLGYGAHQKRINATITEQTSNIAVDLACDKEATKTILREANIPVSQGSIIFDENELKNVIKDIGFPVVIKPHDGNHGNGVTLNINNEEQAAKAFYRAKDFSEYVIVEKYYLGNDFRLLVIDYKLCAASLRNPACVIGDGTSTIQQLIQKENDNPDRGEGHEKILTKIRIDEVTLEILQSQNFGLDSVPPLNTKIFLKHTANLSSGGTSEDVTDKIHPDIKRMAERVALTIGLDICGIDIISTDISLPLKSSKTVVIEVNAAPGFRMHTNPTTGQPRQVGKDVVKMLFPGDNNGRIPLIAITGTNGKTSTTRLIAEMAKTAGFNTGYTTTEGIYIGEEIIEEGDCTGPASAKKVLKDKTVEFAVLECARGGILRSGLGFDQCDVAIVTNVAEDHIGMKDINSLDEMAKVKSVVPETVKKNGFAILNADNEFTLKMPNHLQCNIAFFSTDVNNIYILNHIEKGGIAAVLDNKDIVLLNGKNRYIIENIENVPFSFHGKAKFMIENALASVLAAYVSNISLSNIQKTLVSFIPTPQTMPGRMNIVHFNDFRFLIDYAHNFHGISALGSFLKQEKASSKVGIIAATGDRRDVDIINIGRASAEFFDKIIIRVDEDTRGRNEEEIIDLLWTGVHMCNRKKPLEIIKNEISAIKYAVLNAKPGSLIVLLSDNVKNAIDYVSELKELDKKQNINVLAMNGKSLNKQHVKVTVK